MTQHLAVVPNDHADTGYSQSGEFSPRQLLEAYGTIFALKLKLEASGRELALLCETRDPPATVAVESTTEFLVETAISERARRNKMLPAHLFADPAWDMMLELYRAKLRQYRVSVSNLCNASKVPPTTALRWIGNLETEGLIARDADPLDRRRHYVRLTGDGSKGMIAYFSTRPAAEEAQRCAR